MKGESLKEVSISSSDLVCAFASRHLVPQNTSLQLGVIPPPPEKNQLCVHWDLLFFYTLWWNFIYHKNLSLFPLTAVHCCFLVCLVSLTDESVAFQRRRWLVLIQNESLELVGLKIYIYINIYIFLDENCHFSMLSLFSYRTLCGDSRNFFFPWELVWSVIFKKKKILICYRHSPEREREGNKTHAYQEAAVTNFVSRWSNKISNLVDCWRTFYTTLSFSKKESLTAC